MQVVADRPQAPTTEGVQHVNRIKGMLFSPRVSGYEPLRRDRWERPVALQTGYGCPLRQHSKHRFVANSIGSSAGGSGPPKGRSSRTSTQRRA
jgi:hypothetical protein